MKFNLQDFNLYFLIGDKFSKFTNDDIIRQMEMDLDKEEMFDMVMTLDPKVHSINSFFTFFLINEHSKFIDKLNGNEAFRMAFAGYCDDAGENLLFAGYQKKDFYEFCEFVTEHDLWPDKTDVRNRRIQSRGFISRNVVNYARKGVCKISKGRFCKPYDSSILSKPVRGFRLIVDELHKAGRQDLIDVCLLNSKSTLKESIYPMVLRTIADCDPQRLMNMGGDKAVKEAIKIYYRDKFKLTFIQKLIRIYIPKLIGVIFVFTKLFKPK